MPAYESVNIYVYKLANNTVLSNSVYSDCCFDSLVHRRDHIHFAYNVPMLDSWYIAIQLFF